MELTDSVRYRIIQCYCILFFISLLIKFFNNGFLFQIAPAFFYNQLDLTTWIVMLTNLQKTFLNNRMACFTADLITSVLPFIYLIVYKRNKKLASLAGILTVVSNFIYVPIYCSFPSTDSLQVHFTTLLFPLVFIPISLSSFWFVFQGLRYIFLLFFASAGIYKIIFGGIFNINEMSAILIYQHKELITSSPDSIKAHSYQLLIAYPYVGYFFYLAGGLIQLSFLAGFITRRLDIFLAISILAFLIMDTLLMRIYYWEILPVIIPLIFSRFELPQFAKKINLLL